MRSAHTTERGNAHYDPSGVSGQILGPSPSSLPPSPHPSTPPYLNHSLNPSLPTSRPDLVSIVSHLLFVSPQPRSGGRRARAAPHQTAWLCRVDSPPVTSSLHIQDAGWKWGKWICCPPPPPGRDIRNSETRLVLAIFLPSE